MIVLTVLLAGLGACAAIKTPQPYASIAPASETECAVTRAALLAVLSEEPFYSKPAPPPAMSFIAITPSLVADIFEDNPYEDAPVMEPRSLSGCVTRGFKGPRGRIMVFEFPQALRNERIIDHQGWVARPVIEGDSATVLISRGLCYRTTTIELFHGRAGWEADKITHAKSDVEWAGRHPCDLWR